jgi:hypothetical protein
MYTCVKNRTVKPAEVFLKLKFFSIIKFFIRIYSLYREDLN